ncbi:hypothetical protein PoB_006375500 [Plakobranchus ocellatus]|uniref:Uncharacterized protein n=1 Tax=Plakobranchus ocellatus TaxID=259542 RepID=A0AAV4CZL3_9GAST|nr:hypothetical protein PoB_006375500 [Plakobranchus ocellatus]
MPAALQHQDFVPPSDVNTSALALGRTSRPFASHINIASSFSTLMCRHVYLPWLRATLQELRTSSVVCLSWQSGYVGSSFIPHRTKFAFEGRSSDTAQIRKLILSVAMCQISFQVTDLCNALYQLGQ